MECQSAAKAKQLFYFLSSPHEQTPKTGTLFMLEIEVFKLFTHVKGQNVVPRIKTCTTKKKKKKKRSRKR